MVARRKKNGKEKVGASGRDRILDAAEHLFARHGFYGVSVRDITKAAGVDVALVSYHFGGKRELFAAVLQRRAEQLNPERLAMLEEVRRAALPGTPTLEQTGALDSVHERLAPFVAAGFQALCAATSRRGGSGR